MPSKLPFLPDVGVLGTGGVLGRRTLTNEDLRPLIGNYDDKSGDFATWVDRVTHIQSRQWCEDGESVGSMGTEVARQAIEMAGIDPETVDLVIVATFTANELYPGDVVDIARSINSHCGVFTLTAGCAGSLYGMAQALAMVRSGYMRNVVVIGVEQLSRTIDVNDPLVAIIFADGAGAVVIGRREGGAPDTGMIDRAVLKHQYDAGNITMSNANLALPSRDLGPWEKAKDGYAVERQFLRMQGGSRVLRNAINAMTEVTVELLGYTVDDLKDDHPDLREMLQQVHLVPHQANGRIIDGLQEKLGLHPDRVYRTIYHAGNMSAATNVYTLDWAMRHGNRRRMDRGEGNIGEIVPCGRPLAKGDLVVVCTIGGGYVYGAVGFRL